LWLAAKRKQQMKQHPQLRPQMQRQPTPRLLARQRLLMPRLPKAKRNKALLV
jgi:hypothetical protein